MNLRDDDAQPKAPTRPKLTGVLTVSVALHLLIGFLLFREYRDEVKSVPKLPAPIQAKLVFVDLPTLPTAPPAAEPPVTEEVEPAKQESTVQSEAQVVAEAPTSQQTPPSLIPAPAAKEQQREDLPPIVAKPNSVDDGVINLRGLAKQHLQGIEAQKQQDFVAGQAGAYRQQRISPELRIEPEDPFLSEDEKLMESMQVNVDCSSAAAKTVAVLSMFTGGGLRCTPGQSVNPYIQNRLNKGIPQEPDNRRAIDSQTK